jgi:cell surface protein SprA
VQFDIRSYKKLQMYIHAESSDPNAPIEYGDASVFMRLGNDFDQNYYEYEVPCAIGRSSTAIRSASGPR